jgi:hypothetical protein
MPKAVDWAPERAASNLPTSLYHWERAATLLKGVHGSEWPDPYERKAGAANYQVVDVEHRSDLLRQCAELQCETHVAFDRGQVADVLNRRARQDSAHRRTRSANGLGDGRFASTRWWRTEDDVFVFGEDAAAVLLQCGVVPSEWPMVYEGIPLPHPGAKPELPTAAAQLMEDQSDAVRRLFTGQGAERLYIRKQEGERAIEREEAAQRTAFDVIAKFNADSVATSNAGMFSNGTPAFPIATPLTPAQRSADARSERSGAPGAGLRAAAPHLSAPKPQTPNPSGPVLPVPNEPPSANGSAHTRPAPSSQLANGSQPERKRRKRQQAKGPQWHRDLEAAARALGAPDRRPSHLELAEKLASLEGYDLAGEDPKHPGLVVNANSDKSETVQWNAFSTRCSTVLGALADAHSLSDHSVSRSESE